GAEPGRYQITAYRWSQAPDGGIGLKPATDLLAYPQMVSLGPGEERIARIAFTGKPGAAEATYRLIVEELPTPQDAAQPKAMGLHMRARFNVPVFVAPAKIEVKAAAEAAEAHPGELRFRVRNSGTVRVRPTSVVARALDADGKTTV